MAFKYILYLLFQLDELKITISDLNLDVIALSET